MKLRSGLLRGDVVGKVLGFIFSCTTAINKRRVVQKFNNE